MSGCRGERPGVRGWVAWVWEELEELIDFCCWVFRVGPIGVLRALRAELATWGEILTDFRHLCEASGPVGTAAYHLDEVGLRRDLGDGQEESVRWNELRAVLIHTTDDGPFGEDFFWVLFGEGGSGVVVGNAEAVELGLLDRLQELEGFDNQAVIQASFSVEEAWFPCWQREESA